MVHKSVYVEDKKNEEKCSNYTMNYESGIVDVWGVAGTKQTTESGGMKQCFAVLELQGLITSLSIGYKYWSK